MFIVLIHVLIILAVKSAYYFLVFVEMPFKHVVYEYRK